MENNTSLDQEMMQTETSPQLMVANGWKRFGNMFIDMICYYILILLSAFVLGKDLFLGSLWYRLLITYSILFLYYTILEGLTGKTVGKMITGTKVVDDNGNMINFNMAMKRSLCRFIPFEGFSFLSKNPIGWHDSIPKTYVIEGR